MKKILLFTIAAMLLAVSCSTEDEVAERSKYGNANKEETVFYATTEATALPESKVYADEDLKVLWNENDCISIFNFANVNDKYMFNGEDGDNSGGFSFEEEGPAPSVLVDLDHIYAVYPYSASTQASGGESQETITVNLPAEQLYRENCFGLGANTMVAVSDNNFLGFKNVCGYLKFRFYGDNVNVKSVTLEGNNGEKIAGKACITPSVNSTPTVAMDQTATGSITINCSQPVTLGSSSTDFTEFIFVIPPTTFANGFKVTVIDDMDAVFEKSSTRSLTITRNQIESMAAMKVTPVLPPTPNVTYTLVENQSGLVDGVYIIAAAGYDKAMGGLSGTIHTSEDVTKTENGSKIELDDSSPVLPVLIKKNGSYWTIQNNKSDDTNYGYYLAWSSGNTSIEQTSSYNWTISISSGVATIKSAATTDRSLQYNQSSPRFCCYTSSQKPVALYIAQGVTPVTGPVINVTSSNPMLVGKAGGAQTASYTITNPVEGTSLSAVSTASWITNVSVSSSTITFNVAAQASGAHSRTGVITLSYSGASSVDLTVSQEAGEGGGEAINGWLELPASQTGSDFFTSTFFADGDRNYTYMYQYSMYTCLWVAYPLYSATMGSSEAIPGPYSPDYMEMASFEDRGQNWAANPQLNKNQQINVWSGSYGVNVPNSDPSDIYARGHQIPNADRSNNSTMQTQTYYATNSTPQIQNRFNGYIWGKLEDGVRESVKDTVYVVTGACFNKVGENKTVSYIQPQHDSKMAPVPNYYWKVLLKVKRSGNTITSAKTIGFWFEHKQYTTQDYSNATYRKSVDQIEEWTGFDFFVNLPADIQATAEINTDWSSFKSF